MSQTWAEEDRATVPTTVVQSLGNRVGDFAEDVTRRVQSEITAYAGPVGARRARLIAMATAQAATLFVQRLGGKRPSPRGVDDLFSRMGYGEGIEEHSLDALSGAVHLAARQGWRHLQRAIVEADLPASTLARVGEEVMAYADHLVTQARSGHKLAGRSRDRDVDHNRRELLLDLLEGRSLEAITAHAAGAGWVMPAQVTVLAGLAESDAHEWPQDDSAGRRVLSVHDGPHATFILPAEDADAFLELCRADGVVLARCWDMDVVDTHHAVRWAQRTIELVEAGVLPRVAVIDCSRYYSQLWLHGEAALRRHLAQELLSPLFTESPNSREILSETLLVWLETRESAPAIAAILGVHPQTVRYRWRRINELFGDTLRDPEYVGQLTMVLKSSLPLWLAGHKSDFERYWNEEAG